MDTQPKEYIVLKALSGNDPPQLNAIQAFLEPHLQALTAGWFIVWCITVCVLVGIVFREYKKRNT